VTINMSPEPVKTAGSDLAQVADSAKKRVKTLFHSSEQAAQDNSGWGSAGALQRCKQAWEAQIDGLINQTNNDAEGLKTSAGNVAASDQEAENRLQRVLGDLASN
jgi:hypothetical protein